MISTEYLYLILGCFIVTWIPRILPFAFAKKTEFSGKVSFISRLSAFMYFDCLISSEFAKCFNWKTSCTRHS
ncbi:AzlD domain-containing protein [Tetragenococcus muriaticus]|uniref:AzlD domain-containing protein n=1 Tax=Tetragenococcus muriaticus TaxID=64642 RepID=UPI0039C5C65B